MKHQHEDEPSTVQVEAAQVVAWLSQLRADVAQSVGGVMLRGARPVQVGTAAGSTPRPTTAGGAVLGYSLRNADANPATVYLRDGSGPAGDLVAVVTLAASAGASAWWGPGGLNVSQGLFIDTAAAPLVEGAIYLRGAD